MYWLIGGGFNWPKIIYIYVVHKKMHTVKIRYDIYPNVVFGITTAVELSVVVVAAAVVVMVVVVITVSLLCER
jgi:hypothetical protein